MADKMMRIAGRDSEGLAKALKVDSEGAVETRNTIIRDLFDSGDLLAGEKKQTGILDHKAYTYAKSSITVTNDVRVRVTKTNYRHRTADDSYIKTGEYIIYESDGTKSDHYFDYNLESKYYTLTIENLSPSGGFLADGSFESLGDTSNVGNQKVKVINEPNVNKIVPTTLNEFNAGVVYETDILPVEVNTYAKTTIVLATIRKIKVSIKNYYYHEAAKEYRGDDYKVVYTSTTQLRQHYLEYSFDSDYYSLKIENIDSSGTALLGTTKEVRVPITTPSIQKTTNGKLENIVSALLEKVESLIEPVKIKTPKNHLVFSTSPIKAKVVTKGHDNLFYLFNRDNVLEKYEDIKVDSEPSETGITWDTTTLGELRNIVAFPNSIVVFANHEEQAKIYHMDNMNDTPSLVYSSNTVNSSYWANRNAFGIKHYYNGLGSYVIAGVYGRDPAERDLLLSTDGGQSFEVIKKTSNTDGTWNSHWHDVAFDVYHGFLWCSEGDEVDGNQNVYFSDDFGSTWKKLLPEDGKNQPTAIIPFADKVVFGRDSKLPGFDVYKKPILLGDYTDTENEIKPLKEFRVSNTLAYQYYTHSPVHSGDEGYVTFSVFPDKQPQMIMGTGDGGSTWHTVFMSALDTEKMVQTLFYMDDEYVYCYGDPRSGDIVFAKKPEWE